MAAVLLKARPKVPVSFEDVSVCFTKTEWKLLDVQQRILYKTVMLENYHHLVSLGFLSTKPHLVSWLEQGEGPWATDIWRSTSTGDADRRRDTDRDVGFRTEAWPRRTPGARSSGR
ncbi:unnamed protein product [Gulo gulo]|uniref:KRAB domain-containing protein n=1 Tax=Gulo gulo TaxID=48420 RepID=A0A9X9LTD1_GULGU|nr:unnamed protein product [Gulo gulo]